MSVEKIAYDAGLKRLKNQEKFLESFRLRMVVLLVINVVVAMFTSYTQIDPFRGISLVCAGVSFLYFIQGLFPKAGWVFDNSSKGILEHYKGFTDKESYSYLAGYAEDNADSNEEKIEDVILSLQIGLIALIFQVMIGLV